MVILHFATTIKDYCSGVPVAVMQYLSKQNVYAEVGFVNEKNENLCDDVSFFLYTKKFKLDSLPSPFNKPDIIVFHEMYSFAFLKIYKQALKKKIPYVIVPHGGLTKTAQRIKAYKKIPANILFSRFYRRAAAFHFLTMSEMNNSIIDAKKYFVIPNGVDEKTEKVTQKDKSLVTFTFIGRFDFRCKGLDILIDAIDSKKEYFRKKNVRFRLFGPIDDGYQCVKKVLDDKKLFDIVSLNGPVLGKEKHDVLMSTTYFVQTSRSEGLPMGILEALSYGIPCCLTTGTNLTDDINNYCAGFSSSNNPTSVANMLIRALSNVDYESLSNGALSIIKEKYSWNIVAIKMIDEYKKLIVEK